LNIECPRNYTSFKKDHASRKNLVSIPKFNRTLQGLEKEIKMILKSTGYNELENFLEFLAKTKLYFPS
jgi:hypothetical protein